MSINNLPIELKEKIIDCMDILTECKFSMTNKEYHCMTSDFKQEQMLFKYTGKYAIEDFDTYDWEFISEHCSLPITFIRRNVDKIDWDVLSRRKLPIKYICEFADRLDLDQMIFIYSRSQYFGDRSALMIIKDLQRTMKS